MSVTAIGSAMPREIIELNFIALRLATLRLADGARRREIIEHGKARGGSCL